MYGGWELEDLVFGVWFYGGGRILGFGVFLSFKGVSEGFVKCR